MAKRDDDRPTLTDCLAWRDDLVGRNQSSGTGGQSLDGAQDEEEALYFQKFALETPGGKLAVKTGSAPADADAAVDSLVPADIQVKAEPRRGNQKYQDQAKKLALLGRALVHDWRRRRDPLRLLAFDQVVRRVAVARQLYDPTLYPRPRDLPEWAPEQGASWNVTKNYRNPLLLERRNPRHCSWRQLDDGTIAAMVEHYPTTTLEAKLAFSGYPAVANILRGLRSNDNVWVSDLWIGDYRCVLINDRPIFDTNSRSSYHGVVRHLYPQIPYMIAPFRELGFDDFGDRYRGLLTNAAGLYSMESTILSMSVWQLAWNAWRTWVGHTSDGRELHIEPGRMLPIDKRKDEYIEMLQGEPVPPELLQMTGIFDNYIARNGVGAGPRGGGEGARSASQVWAQQSTRNLKLEPAKNALQELIAQAIYFSLVAIEQVCCHPITLPVPGLDASGDPIGSITIKPGDIDGYYDACDVNFGSRVDPAQLEQAKALQVFAQNNWMPLEESWRMSGLTNDPEAWKAALVRQAVERLPFMIEMYALEATKSWWGEKSFQYQLLLKRTEQAEPDLSGQQAQGAAAAPGAPGVPTGGGMQPMGQGAAQQNGPVGQDLEKSIQIQHRRNAGRPPGAKAPPGAIGGAPPGQVRR